MLPVLSFGITWKQGGLTRVAEQRGGYLLMQADRRPLTVASMFLPPSTCGCPRSMAGLPMQLLSSCFTPEECKMLL